MSAPRPNFIDLRSQSQASLSRPLKSPRLHVAGEAPPELSPLDAFALQSRMLAKQLEESAKADKRVSRLPPLTMKSPLVVQGRSDYFRSMSYDSYSDDDNGDTPNNPTQASSSSSQPITPTGFGSTPEVEVPAVRPRSMHPRMSHISPSSDVEAGPPPLPAYARERERLMRTRSGIIEAEDEQERGLFGARRDRSPSPFPDDASEASREKEAAVSMLESEASEIQTETKPHQTQALQLPEHALRSTSSQDLRLRQLPPESSTAESQQPHIQPKPKHNLPPLQQTLPYHQTPTSQPSPYTPSGLNPSTHSPEKYAGSRNMHDPSSGGLAPPRPLFPKRSSSILSSSLETTDEDGHGTMSSSLHSLGGAPRKLSNSSGMSGIASPGYGSFHRSPSFGSDMSAPLPRPSFNFSRPLSRVGTPGLESPARQASSDSHTSYSQSSLVLADDSANTPISTHSEGFPDPPAASSSAPDNSLPAASSYIYSKFTLPRGKVLQRSANQTADNLPPASSQLEQMIAPSSLLTLSLGGQAPPSPPTRPSSSGAGSFARPSLERTKLSTEILAPTSQPSPNPSRPSTEGGRSFEDTRGRALIAHPQDPPSRGRTPMSVTTTNTGGTTDSNTTIKARSMHSLASAADIPAEEHVDKAVSLHEQGLLNESTYHLRHAARQGHPTGMLLYALACRHGWGMRANPREGAEWLRKAADCASIEIADDEALLQKGKNVDALERKTRKAQFALSIYELGVSYMNGWGIEQDRALALRCFEIAGSWGDVDALAEAGFCYAQGIGCKKNLKTSSKFYRQAEAKGMSMVGNSWIYKSKYNDDKESVKSPKFSKDDKARSKSRTRNIFGIKHSS
ncbi:cell cycle inhibitor protein [Sporothrix schenckii 1099-18]|uniref:Cell cycle inhibitor protein n=1 Tax=Sporothrix schenckii 1099-18 TaxID=1397361 RepID=A0A0F2M0I1_SPOSC|nr:cell cycle inhibitor protein [Sporothrix schenckii 1099-18]KJR82579.1 cell cycle inhibitor protein [Sporothrix schenckii 1099-18]